jgi:hypothetical protein
LRFYLTLSTNKKTNNDQNQNPNILEMNGEKWEAKDTLIIFGMKKVKFTLKQNESKPFVLFALANNLGVKKFPQLTVNCSYLDQQFDISCLRPVSVNFE